MNRELTEDQKIVLLNKAIIAWVGRLKTALEVANLDPRNVNYRRDVRLIAARLSKTIAAELGQPADADVIYEIYKDVLKIGLR